MSISEQVKELREVAKNFSEWEYNRFYDVIDRAADTIEFLSAKLADMERPDEDCYAYILSQILEYLNKRIGLKLKLISKSNDETFNFGCKKAIEAFQEARDYIEITFEKHKEKQSAEDCDGWILCSTGNMPDMGSTVLIQLKSERDGITGDEDRIFDISFIRSRDNSEWVCSTGKYTLKAVKAWKPIKAYHEP